MSDSPAAERIDARIFVVGTPRSGTTLLQSLLAAHPQMFSLPETHFFVRAVPRSRLLRATGLSGAAQRRYCADRLALMGCTARGGRTVRSWAQAFQHYLDSCALEASKTMWLEKTPQHLHRIESIERYLENVLFLHILRNGEDVVSSLYDVTHKHPDVWGGARSLDSCLERWLSDVAISATYRASPGHLLVSYEALVTDTKAVLRKICAFLGTAFSQDMLSEYRRAYRERVGESGAEWTAGVDGELAMPKRRKFFSVFDEVQRRRISGAIETAGYTDVVTGSWARP